MPIGSQESRDLTVSRYNHLVEAQDGSGVLLFNSSTGAMVKIDRGIAAIISAGTLDGFEDSVEEQLCAGRFLVPVDLDERLLAFSETMAVWYGSPITQIVVAPTMACNFNCPYCFEGPSKSTHSMDSDTIGRTVEFVTRLARGSSGIALHWFGGEPLLEVGTVLSITSSLRDWVEDNRLQFSGSMSTNGFLLTPAIVDKLVPLGITNATITLDGPRHMHDQRRILKGGGGSFARIVENLKYAVTRMRIAVRSNVDHMNESSVSDLYSYLVEQGIVGDGQAAFYVSPVDDFNHYPHCMSSASFLEFFERWCSMHKAAAGIWIDMPTPSRACMVRRPKAFAVDPDGQLYKCLEVLGRHDLAVGSVHSNPPISLVSLQRWSMLNPFEALECMNCSFLPSCRGGCASRWLQRGEPDCRFGRAYLDSVLRTFNSNYEEAAARLAECAGSISP